jgi:formylmethanofuran dehydrogenase subunit E
MFYTDDPERDFRAYDAKQARYLAKLPKCADCDEPIQEDHFYLINDEPICADCMEANYRKRVEDYVE